MSEPTATQRGPADPGRGAYEPTDVDPGKAWLTLAAIIGTLALTCAGTASLFALFGGLREPTPPSPVAHGAPMLQTDERADRAAIEARSRPKPPRIYQAMRQTAAAGWDSDR